MRNRSANFSKNGWENKRQMENHELEMGEVEINFDPEINEANFRRMELTQLIKWLNEDATFDDDLKSGLVDNAVNELAYINKELRQEWKELYADLNSLPADTVLASPSEA